MPGAHSVGRARPPWLGDRRSVASLAARCRHPQRRRGGGRPVLDAPSLPSAAHRQASISCAPAKTGSSAKTSLPVTLAGNTVHTEVVVDGSAGLEIVNLVDAAGAGQPPAGGAGTGFGGTAPHAPGSPLPWLAVIGGGALLALTGGIWWRRSRPRRLTT